MIVGEFDCMWDVWVRCGISEVQWLFWVINKYF